MRAGAWNVSAPLMSDTRWRLSRAGTDTRAWFYSEFENRPATHPGTGAKPGCWPLASRLSTGEKTAGWKPAISTAEYAEETMRLSAQDLPRSASSAWEDSYERICERPRKLAWAALRMHCVLPVDENPNEAVWCASSCVSRSCALLGTWPTEYAIKIE